MSFGTYARRVRDRDLPYGARYRALRCAVGHYCPIGFNGTWSYLSTVGDMKADEEALIRALDILEAGRNAWLAEMEAFAARRRAEKRRHRRSPTTADRLYLYGCRWPGADGHEAMLHEISRLWAEHLCGPFPKTPVGTKGDLVYLDSTIAGCVSTYLSHDGETSLPAGDVMGYLVYRSGPYKPFTAPTSEVIARLGPHDTRYVDSAVPALTGPNGGSYTYRVTVWTRSGASIPGENLPVQFPPVGRTEIVLRADAAATLSSNRPKTVAADSHSDSPALRAGHHTAGTGVDRVIFRFGPLPAMLRHAAKVEAHLSLWNCTRGSRSGRPDPFRLYELRRPFTGSQATWNNAAAGKAWTDPGGDYGEPAGRVIPAKDHDDPMTCDVDATAPVRDWIDSPGSTHGLLLKADNETSAPLNQMTFSGLQDENPGLDPTLVITYTSPKRAGQVRTPTRPSPYAPMPLA